MITKSATCVTSGGWCRTANATLVSGPVATRVSSPGAAAICSQQRCRAARGDRYVAVAEEFQDRQRVVGGPVQADVARHRGDPAQFQPGVAAAKRDRERVVDARIAVE